MGSAEISTAAVTSTVMLVFSIIFTVILAIAALVGFFRRWKRSTVGLCRIILAVILAAVIVIVIGTSVNFGEQIAEFVSTEIQETEDAPSQTAVWWAISALYSVVVPFFFTFLFVVIAQILRIPAYFISKALHITKQDELAKQNGTIAAPAPTENAETPAAFCAVPPQPESQGKKIAEQTGGALISAFCALIVICVLLLPVTGLVCSVVDGLDEFSETAKESETPITIDNESVGEITVDGMTVVDGDGVVNVEALNSVVKKTLGPVRNNFFVAASYSAPMKLLYNGITTVKIKDATVSFGNEIRSFFELASNAVCFVTDFENYGDKQVAAADKLADYIVNSKIHCQIAAEVFSAVAKATEKPADNEFVAALLETLERTTPESVAEDVITVRDIFKSAVRNNIPKSVANASDKEDGYLDILESINADFVYDLMAAIKKNPDFSGLVSPALNYGAETIAKSFNEEQVDIEAGVDLRELSDEQLKEEAEKIAAALAGVKKVVMSVKNMENGNSDDVNALLEADLAPIGAFIDSLQESLLIGDGTRELLVTILRSDKLSESGLEEVFAVIAEHIERGEKVSMEKVLVATKELVKVVNDYQSGKATEEELSESLKTIISNLDPETASITEEIIPKVNAQMINGGERADSEITSKLMTSFVQSLSSDEAKELSEDEEAFEKEVAAFDCILDIINSITSGEGYSVEDAEKIVETVATSKLVTSAVVSVAYDESGNLTDDAELLKEHITDADRQKVAAACANYYNERKGEYTEEELNKIKTNLAAIASIFDEKTAREIENLH